MHFFKGKERKLSDKVVLVTGASGGLGEQIAYEAARRGATVVVAARRLKKLLGVKELCATYSATKAYAYQLDVASPNQIEAVVKEVIASLGRIDILVNNAGFGYFETALTIDLAIAEEMLRVNLLGLMQITQLVARQMVQQGAGQIINIASQGGKMATPKSAIYSATKFGVLGFSNALRLELAALNVIVTTVNPGPIRTDFFKVADRSGKYLQSVGGLALEPEYVATKVVNAMGTKRREVNLPFSLEVASKLYYLFPHLGDCLSRTIFNKK